ncbi:MAG: antitoxin [Nakamurella sp.]
MRTTVTLDQDTEQLLRERMSRSGVSFKQALNDSIRDGIGHRSAVAATQVVRMGAPKADLDRAMQIAAVLEDGELAAKFRRGA